MNAVVDVKYYNIMYPLKYDTLKNYTSNWTFYFNK